MTTISVLVDLTVTVTSSSLLLSGVTLEMNKEGAEYTTDGVFCLTRVGYHTHRRILFYYTSALSSTAIAETFSAS